MSGEKKVQIKKSDYLSCPFCGGRNCQSIQKIQMGDIVKYYALCWCGCSTRSMNTPMEAFILWNTRQRPQPLKSTPQIEVTV